MNDLPAARLEPAHLDPGRPEPGEGAALPDRATAASALRLVRRLTLGLALAAALLAAPPALAGVFPSVTMLRELGRAPFMTLPLAALLVALAGFAGSWAMAWARGRGDPDLVRRAARWPQALLVVPLAGAVAAAVLLPRAAIPPAAPETAWLWGGTMVVLAFPLLLAERVLATLPPARLPEAPALRGLIFLPTILLPAAGLLEIAAGLGAPSLAGRLATALSLLPCAIAAELALRAAGRCFLPPPPAAEARAAVRSVLARLLAEGPRAGGLAAPVRQHLGIDFTRSWALAYVRAAFAPLVLALLLLSWGLSGVAIVGVDRRAVYERFGAPVRVLQPGLHLVLPWPLGRLRAVEFGTVHEVGLKRGDAVPDRFGAEDIPPPGADRLWERSHANETWFLIAAARNGQQSFHMVNADIRLFYRIGLGDADALRATYGVVDLPLLLRRMAGRVMAGFFAGRTLEAALGENREAMAERLRAVLQRDLDAAGTGLDLTAVMIDAIHPPGGAADAYHAVQAAQISAEASISAERGRAHATQAEAWQGVAALATDARATSAELVNTATADATRFAADRDAAAAAGRAFLFERRLSSLATALTSMDLLVVDHRLGGAEAPLIDLRPPTSSLGKEPTN
ncbi:Protease modulator HflK [Rhodovastum atsumiense]|uniref:Protease modulator HflK n=1 Tax=Rhodovastum atsumiense TaxID=504468 RepID=A0A5M6IV68_9PROT|nr:SPFH domain-containing protein [Rhodovastum atsumiense]KAA5611747.1 protease modulator HflK [Rhodovastum atsumiense]CAH2604329.1 Protease modulator HflK [Rhodovastum atsumiense]